MLINLQFQRDFVHAIFETTVVVNCDEINMTEANN